MMKLILTQEVTGLGGPGDVVEVKDGYGRNYLVPQGLAMRATRGAEKQVAAIRKAREVRDGARPRPRQGARRASSRPSRSPSPAARGCRGSAVRSVSAPATSPTPSRPPVARSSTSAGSRCTTPIKSTGEHTVTVRLHPEVEATVTLTVVACLTHSRSSRPVRRPVARRRGGPPIFFGSTFAAWP